MRDQMKRATLIANGKVQKVGYRDLVQDTARELGILVYVGSKSVVCEGDDAKLRHLSVALTCRRILLQSRSWR
jgi:acylphosphatase